MDGSIIVSTRAPTTIFFRLKFILALIPAALFGSENPSLILDLIVPGTPCDSLTEMLGEPDFTEPLDDLQVTSYCLPEAGIAGATLWCDQAGTIRWARVRLVNDLPPIAIPILFDLVGGENTTQGHALATATEDGGHTVHHDADGLHFYVENEIVREIWLTVPWADLAAVQTASEALWPSDFPTPKASDSGGINLLGSTPETGVPPQLLSVGPVETHPVSTNLGFAVQIMGRVHTRGFKGEEITMVGIFFEENGNETLKVLPSAPPELSAQGGHYREKFVDTVQTADAVWNEISFALLLKHAEGFPNLYGRYVLRMDAYCGNKRAICSSEVDLRRENEPAGRPNRQIMIADTPVVVESAQEIEGAGLLIQVPVEVRASRGSDLHCQVTLRRPDGTVVQASPGWDNWMDSTGDFYALGISRVQYDVASWDAYKIFVPYAALDLPSGSHPLIIAVRTVCENVKALIEFDHTVVKP